MGLQRCHILVLFLEHTILRHLLKSQALYLTPWSTWKFRGLSRVYPSSLEAFCLDWDLENSQNWRQLVWGFCYSLVLPERRHKEINFSRGIMAPGGCQSQQNAEMCKNAEIKHGEKPLTWCFQTSAKGWQELGWLSSVLVVPSAEHKLCSWLWEQWWGLWAQALCVFLQGSSRRLPKLCPSHQISPKLEVFVWVFLLPTSICGRGGVGFLLAADEEVVLWPCKDISIHLCADACFGWEGWLPGWPWLSESLSCFCDWAMCADENLI